MNQKRTVLALDAMGGDHAPQSVVEGASLALKQYPGIQFQFYGDEAKIKSLIAKDPALLECSEVFHTDVAIKSEDKPSVALRQRNSSMRLAVEAVQEGRAHGVVSAGNTGAYMAISKILLKTIPGIERPAIATLIPTEKSACVMLDLGANIQCDVDHLVQFAIMGNVYAKERLGLKSPKVGILNVGSEELKGNVTVQQAAQVLKKIPSIVNFYGFIEGDHIMEGTVDVVVTDGFTGNVALKTMEGVAKVISNFLKKSYRRGVISRLGAILSLGALRRLRQRFDPRVHNGAIFIGLGGIAIKSHGGADPIAFSNAIGVAAQMISHDFNQQIERDLRQVENLLAGETSAS